MRKLALIAVAAAALSSGGAVKAIAVPSGWYGFDHVSRKCERMPIDGAAWTASPEGVVGYFKRFGVKPVIETHRYPNGQPYYVEITIPSMYGYPSLHLDMFQQLEVCEAFQALTNGGATPTIPGAP